MSADFELDNKVIEDYLHSIQLKNGAFSLYGSEKTPDALTTYICIKTIKKLGIKLTKEDELTEWLNSQISQILISM
ncbi:hypothetical protein HMSSN036_74430 [Paenibacillus macerans]|nr:hypothetical protein HMSSN036_74430 [Paenibacillus macerans]